MKKSATKKSTVQKTVVKHDSNTPQKHDARGRFMKKTPVSPVKIPSQEEVKGNVKVSSLPRDHEVLSKRRTIFRIVNPNLPDIKDTYHYTIQYNCVVSAKYYLVTRSDNYGTYSYFNLMDIQGKPVNLYLSNDMEISMVEPGDSDYDQVCLDFDKMRLSNIHTQLAHNFQIGSDPEIFAEKKDGTLIPAFLFLPSKEKPATTPTAGFSVYGGNSMYWDGFQAEFTTKANNCLGHHGDSIASGIKGVYNAVKAKFPDARLSMRSVFHIPQDMLQTADEEYVAFGCMPSINAYGLKVDMPPARDVPFRSAGGHIHFGTGKLTQAKATPMVKALDAILGVACVSLFAEFDDPNRRKLYGLPGEYRLPPHGLEYRPLSNAWLSHPVIMNLVIDLARKCVIFGRDDWMKHWNALEEETLNTIITCDVNSAHAIMERNKVLFKNIIKASYQSWINDAGLEVLYDVFMNGISFAISDPTDFVKNWKLDKGWVAHTGGYNEPNVRNFVTNRLSDSKWQA